MPLEIVIYYCLFDLTEYLFLRSRPEWSALSLTIITFDGGWSRLNLNMDGILKSTWMNGHFLKGTSIVKNITPHNDRNL